MSEEKRVKFVEKESDPRQEAWNKITKITKQNPHETWKRIGTFSNTRKK